MFLMNSVIEAYSRVSLRVRVKFRGHMQPNWGSRVILGLAKFSPVRGLVASVKEDRTSSGLVEECVVHEIPLTRDAGTVGVEGY